MQLNIRYLSCCPHCQEGYVQSYDCGKDIRSSVRVRVFIFIFFFKILTFGAFLMTSAPHTTYLACKSAEGRSPGRQFLNGRTCVTRRRKRHHHSAHDAPRDVTMTSRAGLVVGHKQNSLSENSSYIALEPLENQSDGSKQSLE